MPGDASRQPPNGPALPGIDGDVFPAGLPLVVPRNADHVIGEIFRRRWHKLVGILQRRVLLQVGVWPERSTNPGEAHAVERAYQTAREVLSGQHTDVYGTGYIFQAEFQQGSDVIYCENCGIYYGR